MSSSRPPAYMRGKKRAGGGWYARTKMSGVEYSLGVWGTPESHQRYQRLLAEWSASQAGRAVKNGRTVAPLTIEAMCLRFLEFARDRYRKPDGSQTGEAQSYLETLHPLMRLYGPTCVDTFGPQQLEAVRQAMLDGSWMTANERKIGRRQVTTGWCRRVVNHRISRIKHVFKWAVAKLGIPVAIYQAILCVDGLRMGQPGTRESKAIKPVPESDLESTRRKLGPIVLAMVDLQLLTGARPGEICGLRPCDLDRSGGVWVYRPADHKTAHHGHERFILLGPKAQAVVQPFLERGPSEYCFDPSAAGVTHRPGKRYLVSSYYRAIVRACKRAAVAAWHPHQLRHNAATRLAQEHGWDLARILLGHRTLTATRIYGEDNLKRAAEVIGTTG